MIITKDEGILSHKGPHGFIAGYGTPADKATALAAMHQLAYQITQRGIEDAKLSVEPRRDPYSKAQPESEGYLVVIEVKPDLSEPVAEAINDIRRQMPKAGFLFSL